MAAPNINVMIAGKPKSGKSHFAFTFPMPLVIYSFDRGAEYVIGKHFKDKEITVRTFDIPIMESMNPPPFAEKLWGEIKTSYDIDLTSGFKTVVIDTGTHLWEIIRLAHLERQNRTKMKARDYGEPNANMSGMLLKPSVLGMNMVVTQYLKDVYFDDKATGEVAPDGFKRTGGIVDLVLLSERKGKSDFIMTIEDCRFEPELNQHEIKGGSYTELMALLGF